ncbi:hypothetical protein E4U42_007180 [Claviceps africana]|uniref:Uncharacterized protein n=1 Tax=Claviceps africana TaxID=83212 RepID=A0A8K0J773_9HYPO|nr:hypothetical protein E4U42_007180 [Claviceps africana]
MWYPTGLTLLVATQALLPKTVLGDQTPSGNTEPPPPSQDPFYLVPSFAGQTSPGTILASRKSVSPVNVFGFVPDNIQDSHQILYRTTDQHGKPTATVMTVLVPRNANLSAVLSFQLAEDAVNLDCAPSYVMTLASLNNSLLASATAQLQVVLIQEALADGWVVVVPDFQGPTSAFANQKIAGQAILDALRASLRSSSITGIKENAILALWGYSGGAAVTKYAAEIQPKYARELNLAAVAFGGLFGKSTKSVKLLNKGAHAGLIPFALIGIANENQAFQSVLNLHLRKEFKDKFYTAAHQCLDANIRTFYGADVIGMFTCWDLCVYPSLLATIVRYSEAPGVPDARVYWYHDVHDEVSPISAIDDAVYDYCRHGANVRYERNLAATVNHQNYALVGAPNVLAWLKSVMTGEISKSTCRAENVTQSDLPAPFLNIFPLQLQQTLLELLRKSRESST